MLNTFDNSIISHLLTKTALNTSDIHLYFMIYAKMLVQEFDHNLLYSNIIVKTIYLPSLAKSVCLYILDRPEIKTLPLNVTETERNNVTLICNATGNPEPQFSWYKVKNTVKSNNRINLSANNSPLTITDVNRKDSGGYLCVAHNEVGNDTSIIVILDVQCK